MRKELGFGSVPGGVHPGGTCNVIVPLEPPQYLELLGVADPQGESGRGLAAFLAAEGEQLVQWAVRVDKIEAVAERLNLQPQAGSVTAEDGSTGSWRIVSHPDQERLLPFFIQYDNPQQRRSRGQDRFAAARHDVVPGRITRIEVGGDERELGEWLGTNELPIVFTAADRGIQAAAVATPGGDVTIRKRLGSLSGQKY